MVATPLFGGLSDASLDLLISMLAERRFDGGAIVVAEGEPGRSMYVVHTGELVVSKLGESGRAIWMTSLGPGDFFGEMTLIEPRMTQSSSLRQVNVAPIEPDSARGRLTHQSPLVRSAVMLAEIYMLRLEAAARAAKEAATSSSRFVPVSLPAVKAS